MDSNMNLKDLLKEWSVMRGASEEDDDTHIRNKPSFKNLMPLVWIVSVIVVVLLLAAYAVRGTAADKPSYENIASAFERLTSDAAASIKINEMGRNLVSFVHYEVKPRISDESPSATGEEKIVSWTLKEGVLERNGKPVSKNVSGLLVTPYKYDGESLAENETDAACIAIELVGDKESDNIYLKTRIWLRQLSAKILYRDYFIFTEK